MGLVSSRKAPKTSSASKRRSGQLDFSNLGPLKTTGTVGFTAFRDNETGASRLSKARKSISGSIMLADSDEDEEDDVVGSLPKMAEAYDKEVDPKLLAPDDAKSQGELAEGLNRIRVSYLPIWNKSYSQNLLIQVSFSINSAEETAFSGTRKSLSQNN